MNWIDTHAHLHFPDFESDFEDVLTRLRDAGIVKFMNVGTDVGTSEACIRLAERYEYIHASAGIHPHDALHADEAAFRAVEDMLEHPKVKALGEVGLDFFRDHSPQEVQEKVFGRFLDLYAKKQKPLIIHCRDAYSRLHEILRSAGYAPYRGVMHCFSGTQEQMTGFLDLGFYISFAGPLTYKKNDFLRQACRACPQDRRLLETDAPFLPPQSSRGKRNEPSMMIETAGFMAEAAGSSLEQISRQTTRNAEALFSI